MTRVPRAVPRDVVDHRNAAGGRCEPAAREELLAHFSEWRKTPRRFISAVGDFVAMIALVLCVNDNWKVLVWPCC